MVTRKWYSLYHGERQAYATKPVNGGWAVIRVTAHASKGGVCEVSESNLVVVVGDERYTTQDGAASDTFVSPQNQLGGTLPLRDGEKQDGLVLVDAPVNGPYRIAYSDGFEDLAYRTADHPRVRREGMAKEYAAKLG